MKRLVIALAAIGLLIGGYAIGTATGLADTPDTPTATEPEPIPMNPAGSSSVTIAPSPSSSSIDDKKGSPTMLPLPKLPGDGSALARSVTLTLYARNVQETAKTIDAIISTNKGTVYNSRLTSGRYAVQVVVPGANAAATVQALRAAGVTEAFSTNVSDLSGQIAYTEADLRDAQAREQSLLALIEQAKDAAAKATLEQQLADTRRRIDMINTELRGTKATVDNVTFTIDVANTHLDATVTNPSIMAKAWDRAGRLFLTTSGGLLLIGAAVLPLILLLVAAALAGRLWKRLAHHEAPGALSGTA